jgi:hypothetical protein
MGLKIYTKLITPEQKAGEDILFKEFQTEVLTGKDVILALSPIIDQAGWHVIETANAKGRGVEQYYSEHDVWAQKQRSEKMAIMTNGKNTIMLLDWVEEEVVTRHDPVIRVVGVDAEEIAGEVHRRILMKLAPKLVTITVDEDVAKDFEGLTNNPVETFLAIGEDLKAEAENLIFAVINSDVL